MIEQLIVYIQSIISEYGAWGVFGATLIEEIIAPVPSPLVPLAGGFFLLPDSASYLELALRCVLTIAIPVSIGISIGSAVVYAIGFFGGKPFVDKTKKWTGIKWQDIEKTEARLTKGRGDEITLFILRILPIVPGVAISGLCGVIRYPFKKFVVITCVGAFIRAFVLGMIGWQVGALYVAYGDMVSKFEKYILAGVLCALFFFLVCYFVLRRK